MYSPISLHNPWACIRGMNLWLGCLCAPGSVLLCLCAALAQPIKPLHSKSLQESSIYSNFEKRQLFAFKMNVFSKCTKLNYSKILKVSFLWEEAVALKRTMLVWTVVSTVCSLILAFSGNLMKLKLVNRAPTLSTGPKSPSSSSSNLKT